MTAGRKAVRITDSIINTAILIAVLFTASFSLYALWDSEQLYKGAEKSKYTVYKPAHVNEGKSFRELQAINDEVIAWLSIYGTNIDYPVTQGKDNMTYVNTNAEGLYSLTGSIFLDSGNKSDFSDFANIVYGHHMEKNKMFGDIAGFSDRNMFESHKYGNLYFDGKDHGIEFFAFVHTDAYDESVLTVSVKEENRQEYMDGLFRKSMHKREIGLKHTDRIVLLTTCSAGSTNGRDVLAGRITDDVFTDPFLNPETIKPKNQGGVTGGYAKTTSGYVKTAFPWPLLALFAAIRITAPAIRALFKNWPLRKKQTCSVL